jgi:hypothetical protein
MQHIDEMFAFVSVDEHGEEGLIGTLTCIGWVPKGGSADMAREDSLRAMARQAAQVCGHDVKLVRFSNRTELETFKP